ncbi:MAG: hypothetical protein FJZ57_03345, partial [Chlamydiae bacterium]|nr:hypothetical protein [Chlamydiota bacterium]
MTTSSLEIILHSVNILRGALRVLNSAEDLAHKEIDNTTKIAALSARVLGLSFSVYETNAVIHHASTEELMRIKDLELFEKLFEFGTSVAVARAKYENPDPRKTRRETILSLNEEEILASGLDILRVFNQKMIYTEKHFLEVPSDYSLDDPHVHYHDENSIHPIIDE